jgi:uroporphyrin-3 C-methyltransferase
VNSDIPQIEPDAQEPLEDGAEKQPDKPRRGGGFAAALALLISLTALAGTAWMWWQDQSSRGQEEERVFAEIARLESSDSELALKLRQLRDELSLLSPAEDAAQLAALEDRLAADRAQLDRVERAIREQTALAQSLQAVTDSMRERLLAAEASLAAVSNQPVDTGGELDVAEVDYLLRLANERLQLFADPEAADQALQVADRHLAALDNPAYYGVRQEISAARQALAALDSPDYLEVAAELDAVQSAIPGLPFRGETEGMEAADPAAPSAEDGWWAKFKGVFTRLVTVRRSSEEADARISLQDKDYVRQRVWLQLEIAHLALMRRDQASFRGALGRVQESVDTWFDPADSRVRSVTGRLADLAELNIDAELPDITGPWTRLKGIRAVSSRPAPAPAPAPVNADPENAADGEQDGSAAPDGAADEPDVEGAG